MVTVYCTMPLDVVKTKIQGLESVKYGNPIKCLKVIVKEEGITGLWKGSTPRLGRLIVTHSFFIIH